MGDALLACQREPQQPGGSPVRLTEEQQLLRDAVRVLADEKIATRVQSTSKILNRLPAG